MSGARPWLRSESTLRLVLGAAEGEHPALARRELLVGVEAERGRVAAAADRGPVGVSGPERLAGVLHDREAVGLERGHVGRVAEDVHRQQRGGAVGDRGRGGRGIEVERARVDVGEHRPGVLVEDRVGRGDERERRGHDLVAGLDADRAQPEVQRGGAGGHGARVRDAEPRGEGLLEGSAMRGPSESWPERSTSITAASSASPRTGCASGTMSAATLTPTAPARRAGGPSGSAACRPPASPRARPSWPRSRSRARRSRPRCPCRRRRRAARA